MSRLLLLGCSRRKRILPVSAYASKAIDLYDGPNYRVLRRFHRESTLELTRTRVFVISAKWGIIPADALIEPYDLTLHDLSPNERTNLSQIASQKWKEILNRECYSTIFVGLGKEYERLFGDWQTELTPKTSLYIAQGDHGQTAAALKEWLSGSTTSGIPTLNSSRHNTDVRLAGQNFLFSSEFVFSYLKTYVDGLPESSQQFHSYYVQFGDKQISPKWLVSELTGLSVSKFNTAQACRALISWGIEVLSCSALTKCRIAPRPTE